MDTTLQFALNLTNTHSTLRGLRIDIIEVIVVEVTGLPQIGTRWFDRKATNSTAVRDFLVASEDVDVGGEFIRYIFVSLNFTLSNKVSLIWWALFIVNSLELSHAFRHQGYFLDIED